VTAPGSAPHVFVSSTSVDLHLHRAAVRETLLRMGLYPDAMETWGAQPHGDPATVSVEKVRGCAAMVLIVAWRYGFVPAGGTRSITHLEYVEATSSGRPCYVFLADPATEAAQVPFPVALRDPEHEAALAAFRAQLAREKVVEFFTTPEDLAHRVATSLASLRPVAEFAPLTPHDARVLPQPPRAAIRPGSGEGEQRGLVGRDEELRWLREQIRDPSIKGIWALRGMGGVGKTALVAVAVASCADYFDGGIAVIRALNRSAADVFTADEVLRELVQKFVKGGDQLLKRPGVSWQELSDALVNVLLQVRTERRPALVVIDNVEHELANERRFRDLLELLNAAGVSVVLTSREQLDRLVGVQCGQLSAVLHIAAELLA